MNVADEVPLISLRLIDDFERRKEIVQQIATACQEWGFFQVVDHGISHELIDDMFAAASEFFQLPKATKLQIQRTESNSKGYYDKELTKQKVDWKEVFDFGAQSGRMDASGLDGSNQWPTDHFPTFQPRMMRYFEATYQLSMMIFSLILDSLPTTQSFSSEQLPSTTTTSSPTPAFSSSSLPLLTSAFSHHSSFLRLNYYPICPHPLHHLGISPHTDAGALTVLAQSQVQSLQVFRIAQWFNVQPIPYAFVINIGDIVQVLSNDRYKAPLHRVLARQDVPRFSAPFFLNPDYQFTYSPILEAGETPKFKPVNWGDFRLSRSAGDYADLGEEIQIDHFRI